MNPFRRVVRKILSQVRFILSNLTGQPELRLKLDQMRAHYDALLYSLEAGGAAPLASAQGGLGVSRLADEIDRLDGYLLYHRAEIENRLSAMADVQARTEDRLAKLDAMEARIAKTLTDIVGKQLEQMDGYLLYHFTEIQRDLAELKDIRR